MSLNIEYFNKNLLLVFCLFIATFTSAADYYWVGNSGIWNNPANWASNSGGRGGKGIPDRHDDVHFDQRSFSTSSQTLSINTLATCRNFVWNIPGKEPKIAGNGAWNIHGHFQLITSIKPNFEGTFHFKTQQRDQPLHLGDHNWNADVYFDGEGSWVLQSKLATGKNIYLTKGTLKTAGWVMVCHKFVADGQQQRGLWLGRSAVVIRHGWDTEPSDHMDLQAGQSTLYFHNTVRTADIHLGNLTYNRIEHLDQPDNSNNSETNFGRACNTCATGIGEVPYTICAVIDTFFNGFGVSCKDSCDGTVFVGVNGGVGPFQYSWIGGPNTQQWSGVCAGNQIVIVTDLGQNTQCATTVNLLDPPRLSVLFSNYSPPTCSDACDGVLTVTPVGGVVPYNLCWNGPCPPGETTPTTTALCIGINNFRVTDENGCIFDSTYSINVPAPFFSNISTVDAQCNGVCDGYAISEPVGGNGGPYTWDWTDLGATTDSVGNLCAGTYAVSVFDNAGCRIDTIITISEPPAFNINLVLDVDLLCNNVCTGELEVSAENGTPPFSFQWYFSGTNNPVPGQNTAHATGLCAGDYYVVVTDGSGCSSPSGDFTISEPPLALIDVTTTDANCNGVCDGEATAVIVSGGVPPYTYQWYDTTGNPVPNGTGLIVFNLCSGDYYLEITDSANCLHRSDTVTVDESIEILVNISGFNATCSDSCNGSATVSISGGVAPYAIVWYDNNSGLPIGQAGLTATDLCDGDYYAEVTDANGCVEHSPIQNIAEPPPISITETGSDMSCNRWCDGTASVAVNGGLPGYTIIWYSHPSMVPTGLTGPSATGLCAGSYYAEITDAAGCTMTSNIITIAEPSAIDITSVPQNISCGGLCDGSIALNVSGGTPPYAIVWYNSANDSIGMGMAITALCAGDYYALISDTNGCTIQSPVETITEPPALNGNISGTDVTCNGDCEGTATFTPNGGAPPYNIEWYNSGDNPIGQNGTTAINLCAGDYYAIVTDANNCTDTSSAVTIAEPAALVAVLTTNNPSCGGTCDGSASVAVSGGTLPYTFNWSSGSNTSDTETGLCDNIYTVTVTDAAGCDTVINFILSEPSILLANANGTNPFCGGTCDGTVTSSPSGGTPPYSYQWTDGSNNPIGNQPSLSNLCPDTYTVVVTDANNCTINDVVNLTAPPAIIITQDSIVSASCGGACNGAVFITVTGGAPGYTFEWFPFGSSVPVSTSEDPTGLCPDNYTVVVTDATGCTATLNDVAVTTIPEVSAVLTITQPTCNDACDGVGMVVASDGQPPYTYNWQNSIGVTIGTTPNIGGLCPGNYSVEVTDNGGCTSATVLFTITAPTAMTATTDSTSVTCAGNCDGTATVNPSGGTGTLNVQWDVAANNQTAATAVNLCAGIYTATITDANGCAFDTTVTVTDPLTIVADIAGNDIRCFGICDGQAFVNSITNGTPPFTYAWFDSGNNPIAPGATDTASGLCLGTYYLVVTDANGCNATSNTITITEPPLLAASLANQTNNFCFGDCTGAATLAISGGTAPYVIVWDDPSAQTSVTAINLCAGTYTANVTDANGCTTAVNVALTEPAEILTTSSVVQVSCMGDCNGEATVGVVSGGTPPFTYSWDDPFSQNTPTAINLCAGTYSCTIADANGCNTSEVIAITEPAAIAINTSPVVPTCNGFCDGQVVGRFMRKHGSDKVHEGAVKPFCDAILFWHVCRSHLVLRSACIKVGLKLVGKVFTTPITT